MTVRSQETGPSWNCREWTWAASATSSIHASGRGRRVPSAATRRGLAQTSGRIRLVDSRRGDAQPGPPPGVPVRADRTPDDDGPGVPRTARHRDLDVDRGRGETVLTVQ